MLAFCREAPPEFNDHQRDVFCVFSGTGVGRLREFLNQSKAQQASEAAASLSGSVPGSVVGEASSELSDTGTPDPVLDDSGNGTPVLNITGNHAPGNTPIVPTPTTATPHGLMFPHATHQPWHQTQHPNATSALSQSAPAATTAAIWGHQGATHLAMGTQPTGGAQQHLTGMMGAAVLDEVDEGDEAFGEGSEIMGD